MNEQLQCLFICVGVRPTCADSSGPSKAWVPVPPPPHSHGKIGWARLTRVKENLRGDLPLPCISLPVPTPQLTVGRACGSCCGFSIMLFVLRQTWVCDPASPPSNRANVDVLFDSPESVSSPMKQARWSSPRCRRIKMWTGATWMLCCRV